jgi:hypothetical protein
MRSFRTRELAVSVDAEFLNSTRSNLPKLHFQPIRKCSGSNNGIWPHSRAIGIPDVSRKR